MARPSGPVLAIVAAALLFANGCALAGSVRPSTSPVPTSADLPSPGPTTLATAAATSIPSPTDSATVYTFTYHGEPGGHGGPPLLDLVAPIVIDYAVTRGCAFTLRVTFGLPDAGIEASRFSISTGTGAVSGTWPVRIKPGKYYIVGDETAGCPFHIEARTVAPSPSAPAISPGASPMLYYEVWKTEPIVGGHGGTPEIDLPADVQVDYDVTGTCQFGVTFYPTGAPAGIATLQASVKDVELTGTWLVTIPPGSYEPAPTESDGCTFHLSVHAPG
jgi:hypothetical protein